MENDFEKETLQIYIKYFLILHNMFLIVKTNGYLQDFFNKLQKAIDDKYENPDMVITKFLQENSSKTIFLDLHTLINEKRYYGLERFIRELKSQCNIKNTDIMIEQLNKFREKHKVNLKIIKEVRNKMIAHNDLDNEPKQEPLGNMENFADELSELFILIGKEIGVNEKFMRKIYENVENKWYKEREIIFNSRV